MSCKAITNGKIINQEGSEMFVLFTVGARIQLKEAETENSQFEMHCQFLRIRNALFHVKTVPCYPLSKNASHHSMAAFDIKCIDSAPLSTTDPSSSTLCLSSRSFVHANTAAPPSAPQLSTWCRRTARCTRSTRATSRTPSGC